MKALDAAARTRHQEKIDLYARVLRGAVSVDDRTALDPEDYMAVLAELTPREIEVARAIYGQQGSSRPKDGNELTWALETGWKTLGEQVTMTPAPDLVFVLCRLERTGLIHEITGMYIEYEGGVYTITDTFRSLMRFLGDGWPDTDAIPAGEEHCAS